nr:zinc finger BED domain-containing protein 5-like [Zootoca vivipara]
MLDKVGKRERLKKIEMNTVMTQRCQREEQEEENASSRRKFETVAEAERFWITYSQQLGGDRVRPVDNQREEGEEEEDATITSSAEKYNSDYLEIGFTVTGPEEQPKPQCVICYESLSNECMKPAKLRRHLETKHPEYKSKSLDFFKNKLGELKTSRKTIAKHCGANVNENATLASYEVAQLVAKCGKNHTIAEELILPSAIILCKRMLGDAAAKIIGTVPLSNNTVQRRITDMGVNIEETLLARLRMSDMYALQLDESTDISNKAIMLVFARFLWEDQVFEDFLFSCELLHTKADDIFTALNNYLNEHDVTWKKCVGLSTDGAKAMAGNKTGLQTRVKAVAPEVKWTHCCIHREALVAKRLPEPLQKILKEVVQIINYIKTRPLQSRLFSLLCKEIGSEHEQLLIHTEVRWLSRGRILSRFFELRDEVRLFLLDTKYADFLTNFSWLCSVAYLADVFEHLNVLNLSLQGKNVDMFKVEDKISAMVKKCQIWASRIENKSLTNFSTLKQFLESSEESLPEQIKINVAEHLRSLATTFREYFPEPDPDDRWIRNPFSCEDIHKKRRARSTCGSVQLWYDEKHFHQ